MSKPESAKKPQGPIPAWAWIFAVGCAIIPFLTLGGAIPGAIGFGGAAACIGVARDGATSVNKRILICTAITAGCWGLLILLGFVALWARG